MWKLTVFVTALVFSLPAAAWHDTGHRATAYIAYERMDAGMRHEVATVLAAHPRYAQDFGAAMPAGIAAGDASARGRWLLAQASVWPDMARDFPQADRERYDRGTWHYVNEIVWLRDEDREALDGSLPHNLTREPDGPPAPGMNSVQALRANLVVWHDPASSDGDRAVALCWILHITGDMHQPLHNTALFSRSLFSSGDRGGNLVIVERGRNDSNLHAVWDGLVNEHDDLEPDADTAHAIATDIVDDGAIDRWVDSHANLAKLVVYNGELVAQLVAAEQSGKAARVTLSDDYLERARRVGQRQVILAGHRIAQLLDPH